MIKLKIIPDFVSLDKTVIKFESLWEFVLH